MERAYHLPQLASPRSRPASFGKLSLAVAELSPVEIRSLLAALRAGAPRPRTELPRRAHAVALAARRFLDRADPLRQRAVHSLPGLTGFSNEMIDEVLQRIFEPLVEAELALVAASAVGLVAPVLGIVSAGNIPGVAVATMALGLAAGASCLVKTASGEPLLAVLFAEAITEIDPLLAAGVAALWWAGGDEAWLKALAGGVDSLVAYGSDAAIAAMKAFAPRAFVGHGHKLSVAVVRLDGASREIEKLAADAAIDVALYDQLGCLSPQCLYLVGGGAGPQAAFVDRLAEELDDLSRRLPRGEVPESASLAIRRLRDEYEWREIRGQGLALKASRGGTSWTILVDPVPALRPSPLYRTIFVRPLGGLSELGPALGGWSDRVESVGVGPWPDAEAAAAASALGIPRIAPLGRMQSPDLDWRQGGRDPMAGIVAAAPSSGEEMATWP